jgi:hypothetical protein
MSETRRPTARRIRRAAALAVGGLVAALLPFTAATGAPPSGSISFDIADSTVVPATPGSDGLVYVVADESFAATLTFLDKRGVPAPLSNSDDTTVTLSYGTGGLFTALTPQATLAAGASVTTTPPLTIPAPATGVVLKATATTKQGTTVSDTSAPFDVLIESIAVTGPTSVGGDGAGVPGDCNPTPERPVCGDLLPPANDFDKPGYLSQGCNTNDLCEASSTFVQVLSSFKKPSEGRPAPATLLMNCDKTLCGGGGIKKQRLEVTLTPGSAPVSAEPCPAKGTVGAGQKFCVDYVQSTRDVAGDTILYLLFVEDAKVRFP